MAGLIGKKLAKLPIGSLIRLTFENSSSEYENLSGVVSDNDHESCIEITVAEGKEYILDYSIVRSVSVTGTAPAPVPAKTFAAPVPAPVSPVEKPASSAFFNQPLETTRLSDGDNTLNILISSLPPSNRKLLNGAYDSFRAGVKGSSREKMAQAARRARQIFLEQYQKGFAWEPNAARFCGYLLHRAGEYDANVYLVGNCFWEAALCAYKKHDYISAGAYAALALLRPDGEDNSHKNDLWKILATSIVKTNDASVLAVFRNIKKPDGLDAPFRRLTSCLLLYKGVPEEKVRNGEDSEQLLETLYPGAAMVEAIANWLPGMALQTASSVQRGRIQKLIWAGEMGDILGMDGNTYRFHYRDITDGNLKNTIQQYQNTNLDGKFYWVQFAVRGGCACNIQPGTPPLELARLAAREDRFQDAVQFYMEALASDDASQALAELVEYAVEQAKQDATRNILAQVKALFEQNKDIYPEHAKAQSFSAQLHFMLEDYSSAFYYCKKALARKNLSVRLHMTLLFQQIRMRMEAYETTGDLRMLDNLTDCAKEWLTLYETPEVVKDATLVYYRKTVIERRFRTWCAKERLAEAEEDFNRLTQEYPTDARLPECAALLKDLQKKLAPLDLTPEEPSAGITTKTAEENGDAANLSAGITVRTAKESGDAANLSAGITAKMAGESGDTANPSATEPEVETGAPSPEENTLYSEDDDSDETEWLVVPYEDREGWSALGLTKEALVEYALSLTGENRIPSMLAYLKAGSALCPDAAAVYKTVALAANDPMESPDYQADALLEAMTKNDPAYPLLNDVCMAAAFLRAGFTEGRKLDYAVQGLWNTLAAVERFPTLKNAYDLMESFRAAAEWPIDIYAGYRGQDVKRIEEESGAIIRRARELYSKLVETPPKDNVKFARLLETKRIIFHKDGYLASMLRHVFQKEQDALEEAREEFAAKYLSGGTSFASKRVDASRVGDMISDAWEQAGRMLVMKKGAAILQGDRRNNLRSNISEILTLLCQWYALEEESAGLSWRTEAGDAAYQRISGELLAQLHTLADDAAQASREADAIQENAGYFLLSTTAQELAGRLDGSWRCGQEKYLYADFLRSSELMLDEDFLPELGSTFCALPEFNLLARIRRHTEGPKMDFQEYLDRIFGQDKMWNNYGAAARIQEYAAFRGESLMLPENAEQFLRQTEKQADMRLRSFQERYALAKNYGQIMQSDAFCRTLEDTVLYWYVFCKESKNYGFFTALLQQAEEYIHTSARKYECQLNEELDASIAANPDKFGQHPEYVDAIRDQITQQNFIVAEDWMRQAAAGHLNIEFQQPEALGYLEQFWTSSASLFKLVADTGRSLSQLAGKRSVHNKDSRAAQQMIENWLRNGNPTNASRMQQLLSLLGWRNMQVSPVDYPPHSRIELYKADMESRPSGPANPLHPIAAFGSMLEQGGMYVACLYGVYDCDRLLERIRSLDNLDGNKLLLVDCALTSTDRRTLARKLKQKESGLRNVYLVVDRVMLCYLADNYNESSISRMLMAVGIPFSYCQPYVVESAHTMPPEIFIGRKDELLKIEDPEGVNLIYGGRQLGKSALFKKAKKDTDGDQGKRAVLVDIKDCTCAAAARRLSMELGDLGIIPDLEVTEDWETICRAIRRRLRQEDSPLSYLLIMLDEADTFIYDCSPHNYQPLVELKNVQQALPGRFKFVLAGLHNIVRFNREVALGHNSVITHLSSLKITPFQPPEAQDLLIGPLSYLGFSLPSRVTVSQILATTNYYPGLIQLYGRKLVESIRAADYAGYSISKTPPYTVTDAHLQRVMADKEFVEQIHEKFEITLRLDQDQGSQYYPLALLIRWMYYEEPEKLKTGYSAEDVLRCARDLAIVPLLPLDEEQVEALLQELQDLNILRSVSQNTYLFASKNFRDLLGSDEEILDKLAKYGDTAYV